MYMYLPKDLKLKYIEHLKKIIFRVDSVGKLLAKKA